MQNDMTWIEEAPEGTKIEKIRGILRDRSIRRVEGSPVDVQTANAIITVYDALSEKSQEKMREFSVGRMASVAWKLVR